MNALHRRLLIAALSLAALPLHAKRAPGLDLKDLNGHTQKLAGLRGQVVVLNFWATWCAPCQEELPRLSQLAQSYAGKNVHFVAVSIDEPKDRAKIQPTLQKENVSLDSWVGATTDTMAAFGMGDIVPGTVIVDEQGEIIARIMGEARDEDVRGPVDWLLNGRPGPAPAAMTKRY
jgi:thiol-disulfide isomerase/thioredoxin